MAERNLTLTMPAGMVDYIGGVLGKRPFEEVAPVMAHIQRQVTQQTQPTAMQPRPRSVEAREAAAAGLEEARLASVAGDPSSAEMLAAE